MPNKKASPLFSHLDTDPPTFRHGAQIIWQIAKLILEVSGGKGGAIRLQFFYVCLMLLSFYSVFFLPSGLEFVKLCRTPVVRYKYSGALGLAPLRNLVSSSHLQSDTGWRHQISCTLEELGTTSVILI